MARASDLIATERKAARASAAMLECQALLYMYMDYIRETDQIDAFLLWYAKRLDLLKTIYGDENEKGAAPVKERR